MVPFWFASSCSSLRFQDMKEFGHFLQFVNLKMYFLMVVLASNSIETPTFSLRMAVSPSLYVVLQVISENGRWNALDVFLSASVQESTCAQGQKTLCYTSARIESLFPEHWKIKNAKSIPPTVLSQSSASS